MSREEFVKIMVMLKTAYPNCILVPDEGSKNLWYEMLKDLEYERVCATVTQHIRNSRFCPTIAELRGQGSQERGWTLEWMKLLDGARTVDLNEPGQYAFRLITRNCFESCLCKPEMLMQCMRTFESLYSGYFSLTEKERGEFKAITAPAPVSQIECEEEVGDDW